MAASTQLAGDVADRPTSSASQIAAPSDPVRVLGATDHVVTIDLVDDLVARAVGALEELAALASAEPSEMSKEVVSAWAVGVERVRRQVDAAGVSVAGHIDHANPFRDDGYFTARGWLKHRLQLTGSEAFRRVQAARLHRRSPVWANAEAAGLVGVAQTALMAQVAANPRIDPAMFERTSWDLLVDAMDLPYSQFDSNVRRWEALADADGAASKADRIHLRRNAMLQARAGGGWSLEASFDDVGGAEFNEIFGQFVDAEWRTDWAATRERLGDAATMLDLPRTESQRRADALLAMALTAASAPPWSVDPLPTVNILIDEATFESALLGEPIDASRYRDVVCRTQGGKELHTADAARTALWAHVRRAVYDAAGVVIDKGRRSRLFTGSAREAVMLLEMMCVWVGCDVPVGWCQADHSISWKAHGATVPWNGNPLCRRHNILKEKGFQVRRDETGHWHTYDPKGVEVA